MGLLLVAKIRRLKILSSIGWLVFWNKCLEIFDETFPLLHFIVIYRALCILRKKWSYIV